MYRDLREFIERVEQIGALRRVDGADCHLEIGGITEIAAGRPDCPVLMFDHIRGYPPGFRVCTNATYNPQVAAIALGIDPDLSPLAAVKAWKAKRDGLAALAPVEVHRAPFLENRMGWKDVDLDILPVPKWREQDGGPYIGTASLVVTQDPDSDWLNAAIYRVQKHSKNRVTVQFDHPGRHGAIIANKYWRRGKPCPIAIVGGVDPALFFTAIEPVPAGQSEYTIAGGLKGRPIEVFAAPETRLLVPAFAEIVLEGELKPAEEGGFIEGPFGEFTGYYAGLRVPQPVMEISSVYYRNNPILFGAPPLKPPRSHFGGFRGARLWTLLEQAGITDISGVWPHMSTLMTVIALKQRYAGHAKRAALIAAASGYITRLVIVVDDDVDPSNLEDVMWAVSSRSDASESTEIIRDGWSSHLDPRIPPDEKASGRTSNSKLIINACRPFSWIDQFPASSTLAPDEASRLEDKWRHVFEPGVGAKSKLADSHLT